MADPGRCVDKLSSKMLVEATAALTCAVLTQAVAGGSDSAGNLLLRDLFGGRGVLEPEEQLFLRRPDNVSGRSCKLQRGW